MKSTIYGMKEILVHATSKIDTNEVEMTRAQQKQGGSCEVGWSHVSR